MTTATLTELASKVPADCPVDVKNVKTLNTHDGYAMTATLYLRGKRVAEVENGGTGGCNFYHPLGHGTPASAANREALSEAHRYAKEWAGDDPDGYSEALDLLVEEVIGEKELARHAKRVAARGFAVVAVGFAEPYKFTEDSDVRYGSYVVVGGATLDAALDTLREAGAVAYRVL